MDLSSQAPAVISGEEFLTYRQLEARANQLARYLTYKGAGPGKFVSVSIDHSVESIIAILACLKSGAAYVPIEDGYSAKRTQDIQLETQSIALLKRDFYIQHGPGILLQSTRRLTLEESRVSPSDPCSVTFAQAQGTRPTVTFHRDAYLATLALNKVCGTEPVDRVYQDSADGIWIAFSNGSALVVGRPVSGSDVRRSGSDLGRFLKNNCVTYLVAAPAVLATITEPVPTLRTLVVSGEICPPNLAEHWARPGLRLLNIPDPSHINC